MEGASARGSDGDAAVVRDPLDEDDPQKESYLLADSGEERAEGVRTITTTSPLGSAIVGSREGDEISYDAPGGSFRYRVVEFRPLGS